MAEKAISVRALTPFSLGGGRDVKIGEVFNLPESAAKTKRRQGWVEVAAPEAREPDRGAGEHESSEKPAHPDAGREGGSDPAHREGGGEGQRATTTETVPQGRGPRTR